MSLLARLTLVHGWGVLSALYVGKVLPNLKTGSPRLLAGVPILIVNTLAPCIFDPVSEFITRGCCLLLLTWLANFKVIGYSLNRGPLCQPLTPLQYLFAYALPITPKLNASGGLQKVRSNNRLHQSAGGKTTLVSKFLLKGIALCALVYILTYYPFPVLLEEFLKAFCFYWFLGVLMDGPGALIGFAIDMPVAPHFDSPYLSASLTEFWSKRWNLTVGNALRFLAFDPIHEGRLVGSQEPYTHSKLRSAVATCWTFFVSGAMHEFVFWILDKNAATGEWLVFFTVQGPIVVIESLIARWGRAHGIGPLPRLIAVPYTLLTLLFIAHFYFFPPSISSGIDDRFFSCVRAVFHHK